MNFIHSQLLADSIHFAFYLTQQRNEEEPTNAAGWDNHDIQLQAHQRGTRNLPLGWPIIHTSKDNLSA